MGASSASQPLALSNTGTGALVIVKLAVRGEFSEADNCDGELAVSTSCTINIAFTPRRAGSSTAWLIVSDDGGGSPQRVTLWGVGLR